MLNTAPTQEVLPLPIFHNSRLLVRNNYSVIFTDRSIKDFKPRFSQNFRCTNEPPARPAPPKEKSFKNYTGLLSDTAYKGIQRAANLLDQATPSRIIYSPALKCLVNHRLSFVTLTFPANLTEQSEKEAYKKTLHPLIQWLQKWHGLENYVWRAERTKAGVLHYHILSDLFLMNSALQNRWNALTALMQYTQSTERTRDTSKNPSTEIEETRNSLKAANYVGKYISKMSKSTAENDESTKAQCKPIKGKVWGANDRLTSAKLPRFELTGEVLNLFTNSMVTHEFKVRCNAYFATIAAPFALVMSKLDFYARAAHREFLISISPRLHAIALKPPPTNYAYELNFIPG